MSVNLEQNSGAKELYALPKEDLVAQLLEAQKTIQKLKSNGNRVCIAPIDNANDSRGQFGSTCPDDLDSPVDSLYGFNANKSMKSVCNFFDDQYQVINQVKSKLKSCLVKDSKRYAIDANCDEEFIVAYESKGDFPNCDEDLSLPSLSEDEDDCQARPSISIPEDGWGNESKTPEEQFPLIPSPVLNTPPYEYIFLTKKNEAKYRIFLNQKLNKVFQEELKKLRRLDEEMNEQESDPFILELVDDNISQQSNYWHGGSPRHLGQWVSSSSANTDILNSSLSMPNNVIHCFDPSDVDLDLKKIFTEKPPITHRIVRRKSRKERGSSVAAVDSYYGTHDLNKVGHASYFIPTLTESERKAIGWKPEYHYGHWKYTTLAVPNPNKNPISLHPHLNVDPHDGHLKHHNHHSGSLHRNPLHHHEIDLSEPFVIDEDLNEDSVPDPPNRHRKPEADKENPAEELGHSDGLSFITLSGSSPQSCHFIPDKSTLRKILRWIIPCAYKNSLDSNTTSDVGIESLKNIGECGDHAKMPSAGSTKKGKSKDKKQHEIETIVEPSGKLNFPTSHTYISFCTTATPKIDEEAVSDKNSEEHSKENSQVTTQPSNNASPEKELEIVDTKQTPHHHHHHHHGIFHWKKILSHKTSNSNESMSVVGGDVIDSLNDYVVQTPPNDKAFLNAVQLEVLQDFKENIVQENTIENDRRACEKCFQDSSTESEDDSVDGRTLRKVKTQKLLKKCEAHEKLITLRDLGYESDNGDGQRSYDETSNSNDNDKKLASVISSCDTDVSTTAMEDGQQSSQYCGNSFQGVKKQDKVKKRCKVGTFASTKQSSSSTGENDECSSASSGFPFDSMNISHQSSDIGSLFGDLSSIGSASETSQQTETVETRFLDPKDLMIPSTNRFKPELIATAGFNYHYGTNLEQQFDELEEIYDFDKDVTEWMEGNVCEEDLSLTGGVPGYSDKSGQSSDIYVQVGEVIAKKENIEDCLPTVDVLQNVIANSDFNCTNPLKQGDLY